MNHKHWITQTVAATLFCVGAARADEKPAAPNAPPPAGEKIAWISLFDGKSLGGWEVTKFGGQGEVKTQDGLLTLERGDDMTGVTWTKAFPKMDYELQLEAMRVDGGDFFCGLTFPVGESPCSFIVGGWGGGVVGLSSIDGRDASENETTSYRDFDEKKWYPVRLRVTKDRIEAWVDGKQAVNFETAGHRLTIRSEVNLSRPLGFSTWRTTGALRNVKYRDLKGDDAKPQSKPRSDD